mgnify:CR=1 FL=1
MSLLTQWRALSENLETQEAEIKFWEEYLKVEASIYNEILNNKVEVVEGKVSDLANTYNTSVEYFMGFIDGISESLKEDILEILGIYKNTSSNRERVNEQELIIANSLTITNLSNL